MQCILNGYVLNVRAELWVYLCQISRTGRAVSLYKLFTKIAIMDFAHDRMQGGCRVATWISGQNSFVQHTEWKRGEKDECFFHGQWWCHVKLIVISLWCDYRGVLCLWLIISPIKDAKVGIYFVGRWVALVIHLSWLLGWTQEPVVHCT